MSCPKVVMKKSDILEIEMDLTGTCNLRCPLCTRNYAHAKDLIKPNSRSLEEIIKQLDQFPNLEIFYLAGAVSEPTLYKDFHKFCQYLVDRKVAVELYTNGNTHDEEWWTQLGKILTSNDRVHFVICGPTQELHETYRIGSSLEEILRHHQAFLRGNNDKIDTIQTIIFDYNREAMASAEMQEIIKRFSRIKKVDTEGHRSLNEYIKNFDKTRIRPVEHRERAINAILDIRPRPDDNKKYEIQCMSLRDKKIYIDQFGKINPCYGHAEYEGPGYFSGDVFDYTEVLDFKFHDCFKCEKRIQKFVEALDLEFVC